MNEGVARKATKPKQSQDTKILNFSRVEPERAQPAKKPCRRSNIFSEALFIAKKKNYSAIDVPDAPQQLASARLRQSLAEKLEWILSARRQHKSLLKQVSNTWGLFDYQLRLICWKDRLQIFCIELAAAAALVYLCYSFKASPFGLIARPNYDWLSSLRTGLQFLACFLIFYLPSLSRQLERNARLKISRSLQTMIYSKLTVSDLYFLENADNNLVHLLLYSNFQGYTAFAFATFSFVVPLALLTAVVYLVVRAWSLESLLVVLVIGVNVCMGCLMQWRKAVLTSQYQASAIRQRKALYELLANFKTFVFTSLKPRFVAAAQLHMRSKLESLHALNFLNLLDSLPSRLVLGLALLATAFRSVDLGIVQHLAEAADELPERVRHLRLYCMTLFAWVVSEYFVGRLQTQLSAWLQYRACKPVFDKFFDNDFVVDAFGTRKSGVEAGSVLVEDAQVLERDKANIKETIDFILCADRLPETGLEALREQFQDPSKFMRQATSIQIESKAGLEDPVPTKRLLGKFRVACSGVHLQLRPGQKLCLFENENKHILHSFVGMLLGESQLSQGRASVGGSVSYFNPKKMHLLVGKTIKDNIVFGEEVQHERYDEIMRVLGISFGSYSGLDLHEVGEGGLNLRSEDLKNILFARFLYQPADLYVIEEYLSDLNLAITLPLVRSILRNTLNHKTVIFCACDLELVKLSDAVLFFDSETEHQVLPTAEFLQGVEAARKTASVYSESQAESRAGRAEVLRSKLKNSIFVSSLTFEEELQIHKKQESRRRHVLDLARRDSDPLALVAYGVYLVQQRRSEGRFFEDCKPSLADTRRHLRMLWRSRRTRRLLLCSLLLHLLSAASWLVAEFMLFSDAQTSRSRLAVVAALATCCSVGLARRVWWLAAVGGRVAQANDAVLRLVTSSDIRRVVNKKTHRLLDLLHRHLALLESTLPRELDDVLARLSELLLNSLVLASCSSLWCLPVLLCALFALAKLYLWLLPVLVKVSNVSATIESKIDDLNFQLLSLIGGYRIAGKIDKLVNLLNKLGDNSTKAQFLLQVRLHSAVGLGSIIICAGLILCTLGALRLVYGNDSLNWLGVPGPLFFWAAISAYRVFFLVLTLPDAVIAIAGLQTSYSTLCAFMQQQPPYPKPQAETFKTSKLDFGCPIVFRNVSLTRGLQLVLKRVNLRVNPGERVGLFGIEGGGRSKLFDLLVNQYPREDPEKSAILLFGQPIEQVDEKQIEQCVFSVHKNAALFEGTVRQNLDPYNCTPLDRLREVLRLFGVGSVLQLLEARGGLPSRRSPERPNTFIERKVSMYERTAHKDPQNRLGQVGEAAAREFGSKAAQGSLGPNARFASESALADKTGALAPGSLVKPLAKSFVEIQGRAVDLQPKSGLGLRHASTVKIVPVDINHPTPSGAPLKLQQGASLRSPDRLVVRQLSADSPGPSPTRVKVFETYGSPLKASNRQAEASQAEGFNSEVSIKIRPPALNSNSARKSSNIGKPEPGEPSPDPEEVHVFDFSSRALGRDKSCTNESRQFSSPRRGRLPSEHSLEDPSLRFGKARSFGQALRGGASKPPLKRYSTLRKVDNTALEPRDVELRAEESSADSCEGQEAEEPGASDEVLADFLESRVAFAGKNLPAAARRCILACRAVLAQPRLLLSFEEAFDFGRGLAHNLATASQLLTGCTLLLATRDAANLLFYDRLVFMDSGKVLEKNRPRALIKNEASFLHKYLRETDQDGLRVLMRQVRELERVEVPGSVLDDPSEEFSSKLLGSLGRQRAGSVQSRRAGAVAAKLALARRSLPRDSGVPERAQGFKKSLSMAKQVVIPSPPSEQHRRQLTQEKPKKQKKVVTFDPSLKLSERTIRRGESPDPESAELPQNIDECGPVPDAAGPLRSVPIFRTHKLLDKKQKPSATFSLSDSRPDAGSIQASANQIQTSITFKNKQALTENPGLAKSLRGLEPKPHRLRKESQRSADRLELPSEAFPAAGRLGAARAPLAGGLRNSPPTTCRVLLLGPDHTEQDQLPESFQSSDRPL